MCNLTSEAEFRSKFLSSAFQLLLCPNEEKCHSLAKTQSYQKYKLGDREQKEFYMSSHRGLKMKEKEMREGITALKMKEKQ